MGAKKRSDSVKHPQQHIDEMKQMENNSVPLVGLNSLPRTFSIKKTMAFVFLSLSWVQTFQSPLSHPLSICDSRAQFVKTSSLAGESWSLTRGLSVQNSFEIEYVQRSNLKLYHYI